MSSYEFIYKGGSKRVDKVNYKFHCFISDPADNKEYILFAGIGKGLVRRVEGIGYSTPMSFIKIFTSIDGFGVEKKYFSYFVAFHEDATSEIKIKPLGYEAVPSWEFCARGSFLSQSQVRGLYGSDSDTYKFYTRQSFISKKDLLDMVTVKPIINGEAVVEAKEELRLVRFD